MRSRVARLGLSTALAGLLLGLALALPATSSAVGFGFSRFDVSLTDPTSIEPLISQAAGTHPDLRVEFDVQRDGLDAEAARELIVNLPPGILGDPAALPQCTLPQLTGVAPVSDPTNCPVGSQVGTVTLDVNQEDTFGTLATASVYNVQRRTDNEVALLGFVLPGAPQPVLISVEARTDGDYGLQARVSGINRTYRLLGARLELWGVPADPVHDSERYVDGDGSGAPPLPNPGTPLDGFISSPTRCGASLEASISGRSYERPDVAASRSTRVTEGLTGCDLVPFQPALAVRPVDSARADTPSGYEVTVDVPQDRDGQSRVTSHVQRSEVKLPPGVALNPPVAHGLQACDDAALKLGSRAAAACPNGSRVGSVQIDVPLLGGALQGGLHVRPQAASETYRVAIVASGFGVNVKLPGVVRPDPVTGQLTAIFDQTPQVPFSRIQIKTDGAANGALVNPATCEQASATGSFTPWSGTGAVPLVTSAIPISWDGAGAACPPSVPFSPSLEGGTDSSLSGRTSPFRIRMQRSDREQEVGGLSLATPLGLTAVVRGLRLCELPDAANGSCDAASRIGSITAGAGAGPTPFYVRGSAFLTKGYKGAPYGMSFVIPVVAGPFDLGTVVVQAKVEVDPTTAQLKVTSDPLPRIVRGIPLRLRDLQVAIDRPRFTLNPTNCRRQNVRGRVTAVQGASVVALPFFQASGCSRQPFRPKIALKLRGKSETTDGKHPALAASVEQRQGSANIAKVRAVLPSSLALDPDNAQALCSFRDGQAVRCPKSSIVGRAKISTPLLNRPLRGPVYFVANERRNRFGRTVKTLPTLLITLRGEIALNLRATTAVAGGKNLVTTFANVPDQPFSRFDLYLNGGRNGILTANTNLCRGEQVAEFETNAQSGKQSDPEVPLGLPCKARAKE